MNEFGGVKLNIETPAQAMRAADRWEQNAKEWDENDPEYKFGMKVASDLREWALRNTALEVVN